VYTASTAGLLLAAAVLGACSPTLDWRQVRPEDSRLTMLFPCKPAAQTRRLLLDGHEVRMVLHVCSSGGQTWALSWADTGDPARVASALQALQTSAAANVDAAAGEGVPLVVRGATPNPASTRQQVQGRLPDGRPVQQLSAVFSYGTVVYQVIVLGAELPAEALDTFIGGVQVGA
jgi:hypothetical protein